MKRIAAILLMLLLVYNITGYHFTAQWMQQRQNAGLEKELDAVAYDESTLIEISVPLSLPYYNNWQDFERFDGEIIINGVTHKYVMRKVQDGKLIVKCLPNPEQQTIQKNVSELFAQVNGLPQNESASGVVKKVVKVNLSEYEKTNHLEVKNTSCLHTGQHFHYSERYVLNQAPQLPWQPPEMIG